MILNLCRILTLKMLKEIKDYQILMDLMIFNRKLFEKMVMKNDDI